MQAVVEFLTAVVIWVAATVLSSLGVEVELREPPRVERVVERTSVSARPIAECPEAKAGPARVRSV
jgi:hypothetical protein